ncbi:PKD domain-containing protein [Portibacter lacus]|uniref:PKD domain-containing protein n=1 Tax=Portibacter lacus TaxID=1099794 RepID=A0AA37WFF9_9BACT|nr:PKD domain-containing protein [Portibacter lacus]GLR18552.1 hypothetical protein GCM10007940_31680 [Portibacter lacus]
MKHVLVLVILILGLSSSSLQGQMPESVFSFVVNNQSVDFTDLSTESPTTWLWDFGDGNTSTQQNVTHTFGAYGNYTTCLTVANNFGSDSTCQTVSILPPVPIFSKAFDPPMISEGQSTTLIFTIDNSISNATSANLSFVDNLPAGLQVSAVPNISSTCIGGSIIAALGSTSISYSGGDVGANSSCEIMVDVTATVTGAFVNTTSDLT